MPGMGILELRFDTRVEFVDAVGNLELLDADGMFVHATNRMKMDVPEFLMPKNSGSLEGDGGRVADITDGNRSNRDERESMCLLVGI